MKKVFLVLISLISISINGQEINIMKSSMSLGPQTSYYLEIEDIPKKVVEKEWKKYLKDNFKKVKYDRKAKELYTYNGSVGMIQGNDKIVIYSKLDEGKNRVTLYIWTKVDDGIVNPEDYPSESEGVERYLQDFYLVAKKKGISLELETQEDHIKKIQKELDRLEKKNEKLHSDIEKYKKKISKAEADIEENLVEQDEKRIEIAQQKKVIEEIIERLNKVGKEY
jgi:hypothetical protein